MITKIYKEKILFLTNTKINNFSKSLFQKIYDFHRKIKRLLHKLKTLLNMIIDILL